MHVNESRVLELVLSPYAAPIHPRTWSVIVVATFRPAHGTKLKRIYQQVTDIAWQ